MQLTVKDVSELLAVSEKTVYRWLDDRRLPGYRLSGQYRFNRAELLEWATANRVSVSPAIFHEKETAAVPLPLLSEAIQDGGIFYRLGGTDRDGVLHAVVEALRLPEEVDRRFLFKVLVAREELSSTAVGDGIAMPHPRNPVVLHVPRPTVTLCFLERPVDFGALDGKPVHALFALISPTMRAHLHLLSRLAFALRDRELKSLLELQASREDLVGALRRISASLLPCPATDRV
jgi:nitrogen PTS system EIIA component